MDTALTQKLLFILDRNLAKANCTENHVCTSCDTVVLGFYLLGRNFCLCVHIILVMKMGRGKNSNAFLN